jgi:hypothetical protein
LAGALDAAAFFGATVFLAVAFLVAVFFAGPFGAVLAGDFFGAALRGATVFFPAAFLEAVCFAVVFFAAVFLGAVFGLTVGFLDALVFLGAAVLFFEVDFAWFFLAPDVVFEAAPREEVDRDEVALGAAAARPEGVFLGALMGGGR